MFYEAGAEGEAPPGNRIEKCQTWLKRMHNDVPEPAAVLGKVMEEFMEVDQLYNAEKQETGRKAIHEVLARFGFSYHTGGLILGAASALPTKALTQVLKKTVIWRKWIKSLSALLPTSNPTHLPRLPPRAPFSNRCSRFISKIPALKCRETRA